MKYKLIFILSIFLFTSCSITIVYAPKEVCNSGENNTTEIQGSDLKGNQAEQSSAFDWVLEIPFLK